MSIRNILSKRKGVEFPGGMDWRDAAVVGVVLLTALAAFSLGHLSARNSVAQTVRVLEHTSGAAAAALADDLVIPGGVVAASRYGQRYHFPWCRGVAQINPVNIRWFESTEQARAAGYTPAKNCPGLE